MNHRGTKQYKDDSSKNAILSTGTNENQNNNAQKDDDIFEEEKCDCFDDVSSINPLHISGDGILTEGIQMQIGGEPSILGEYLTDEVIFFKYNNFNINESFNDVVKENEYYIPNSTEKLDKSFNGYVSNSKEKLNELLNCDVKENENFIGTMSFLDVNVDSKIEEEKNSNQDTNVAKKSIKKGRRSKKANDDSKETSRNKYAIDNMINKIKGIFLEALRNFLNQIIKYDQIKCEDKTPNIKLKKLNSQLSGQISMGKMKEYLESHVESIYEKEEISERYKGCNKKFNKGIIIYIQNNDFPLSKYILNKLTLEEIYNIFVRKKVIPEQFSRVLDFVRNFSFENAIIKITKKYDKDKDKKYIDSLWDIGKNEFIDHYKKGIPKKREAKKS